MEMRCVLTPGLVVVACLLMLASAGRYDAVGDDRNCVEGRCAHGLVQWLKKAASVLSPRKRRQTVVVEQGSSLSYRVACTMEEEQQTACLNGHCYALNMGQMRSASCHCPTIYDGPRCDTYSTAYFTMLYAAQLHKALIIGGVVVVIIIIVIVVSVCCSYRKGKKKKKEKKRAALEWNTEAAKPAETDVMVVSGDLDSQL